APDRPTRRGSKKGGAEPPRRPGRRAARGAPGHRPAGRRIAPRPRGAPGTDPGADAPSDRAGPPDPRTSSARLGGAGPRRRAPADLVHRAGGPAGHGGQAVDPIGPAGPGRRARRPDRPPDGRPDVGDGGAVLADAPGALGPAAAPATGRRLGLSDRPH